MQTKETVKELINSGSKLIISSQYDPELLKEFTRLAVESKVNITIKIDSGDSNSIKEIAKLGGKYLTIEI